MLDAAQVEGECAVVVCDIAKGTGRRHHTHAQAGLAVVCEHVVMVLVLNLSSSSWSDTCAWDATEVGGSPGTAMQPAASAGMVISS